MSKRRHSFLRFVKHTIAMGCFACLSSQTFATAYPLPSDGSIIGDVQYVSTSSGQTPVSIAQRYNLGVNAVVDANPGVAENSNFPGGMYLKVPTRHILPPLAHKGIVINLPEMRLYYYLSDSNEVLTFPIGIGKIGKTIPIKNTAITRKVVNPVWIPPEDIREFNRQQGIELPDVMPAGPDNPLGPYAIYLQIPTFLIHSTIFPESIGRRASFGCIRMNEGDIKQFFPLVQPGTPVAIIDMPSKVGWDGDHLYLEAHPALEEMAKSGNLNNVVEQIQRSLPRGRVTLVNWQAVSYLTNQPDGVPHEIGFQVR